MHSWHIAFQDLFPSFELYSSKNIVKCPFSQVKLHKLTKENISKKRGCSFVMELSYFSLWQFFSFEKPNSGKVISLTSYLIGPYIYFLTNYSLPILLPKTSGLVSKHFFKRP
jgi:hypothetical protein